MTDWLVPRPSVALAAWAARVRSDREQVERCREIDDPADFYAPVADRFGRMDPRRTDDEVVNELLRHAHSGETWLDVGAGGGRYALPLALAVHEVVAVEPSPSMIATLGDGMRRHGIGNIHVHQARWPMAAPPTADVTLMAHVGYDIEGIGQFVDAAEDAARRLCVAVMGESATTTVANLFWQPVHEEPRVRLPALAELLVLLLARGRLPEVRLVDREPVAFDTPAEALDMARRQLWLREGSDKDEHLLRLMDEHLSERDGKWSFDWRATKIGIVGWAPR